MKKRLFLLLFFLFAFCTVGYSAFILVGNNEVHNYELNNITDNKIIFDYNDGHSPDYILDINNSSSTVNTSRIPTPASEKNHTFKGWYLTKTGFFEDGSSSLYSNQSLEAGTRLYAKYVNTEATLLSNEMSSSLNVYPKNLGATSNRYYLSSYGNELEYSLNILAGAKLNVFFDDAGTKPIIGNNTYDNTETVDSNFKYISNSIIKVVLDSNIIIDGGELNIYSWLGGNSGTLQALITRTTYVSLDLNGYNIILRNNGVLGGYSIIYNSKNTGGILCEYGTIYTPYLIYGYKGGGGTGAYRANSISPFDNYLCPYLCVETLFTNRGKLIGQTSLYTGALNLVIIKINARTNSTYLNILGNDTESLIQVKEGFLIRRSTPYNEIYTDDSWFNANIDYYSYINSSYREELIFTNNPKEQLKSIDYEGVDFYKTDRCIATLNKLSLNVAISNITLNANLKYVDYPISSFLDISMYNTDFDLGFSLVFMPGSSFYCDEYSVIKFLYDSDTSGNNIPLYGKIFALDRYPVTTSYQYSSDAFASNKSNCGFLTGGFPNVYATEYLATSVGEAKIKINGKLLFDSSASIDFSTNYQFFSLGGNIDLSDEALESVISNASKIKLHTDYAFALFAPTDDYCLQNIEFINLPLLSNNKAYLQISNGGSVIECASYDLDKLVFFSGEKTYFYKYSSTTNSLTNVSKMGLSNYTSSPGLSNVKQKYGNHAGNYAECNIYYVDTRYDNLVYLTSNGINYAYASGTHVPLSDSPTFDSLTLTATVNTASTTKFTSPNSTNVRFNTVLNFDFVYKNCWRFKYA